MKFNYMTNHALERRDQRGISQADIELILQFGECRPCRDQGQSYFLSRESKSLCKQHLGRDARQRLKKLNDTYVVIKSGMVLTVATSNRGRTL